MIYLSRTTIQGMYFLLTWNMKHLANANMRKAITSICLSLAYEPLIICTPEELSEGTNYVE